MATDEAETPEEALERIQRGYEAEQAEREEHAQAELKAAQALGWPLAEIREAARIVRGYVRSRTSKLSPSPAPSDSRLSEADVSFTFLLELAQTMIASAVPFPKQAPDALMSGLALLHDVEKAGKARVLTRGEVIEIVVRGGRMVRAGLTPLMILLRQEVQKLGPDAGAALRVFETHMKLRELVSETEEARDRPRARPASRHSLPISAATRGESNARPTCFVC